MTEGTSETPLRRMTLATLLIYVLPIALVVLVPQLFDRVVAPAPYLVFHNISEFFSIMVSLSNFGVGWFTSEQSRDRHSLLLSASFLVIGLLDFMHSLSNAAMSPFITANSSNKSTRFWIAARLFQGVTMLGCSIRSYLCHHGRDKLRGQHQDIRSLQHPQPYLGLSGSNGTRFEIKFAGTMD